MINDTLHKVSDTLTRKLMHDTIIGLLINKVVVNEIFMLNYRFHLLPFFEI